MSGGLTLSVVVSLVVERDRTDDVFVTVTMLLVDHTVLIVSMFISVVYSVCKLSAAVVARSCSSSCCSTVAAAVGRCLRLPPGPGLACSVSVTG